jgi:non-homologous end joining protein Ku
MSGALRKDQYRMLSDADLNSVKVESSSLMNIEKFVEVNSIDLLRKQLLPRS